MTDKSRLILDIIGSHLDQIAHVLDNLKNDVYDDIPEEDMDQIFKAINEKLDRLLDQVN